MARKNITAKDSVVVGPYSQAIDSNNLVFMSGQTPLDPKTGKLAEGGIKEQTEQVFRNIYSVLEAAGLSFDDVQKVNVFLTSMDDFAAMNDVYKTKFTQPYPARSTIGVAALPLDARIEIELIAKR
uniref:Endoribonuclease L-PSP n=1 Tax=uncultured bacterium contig00027 TaxID=1181516 RepID=A0A806KR50_9BACT|nr:endoribonuclease L-PSP [uncultured bacterium contig00027]